MKFEDINPQSVVISVEEFIQFCKSKDYYSNEKLDKYFKDFLYQKYKSTKDLETVSQEEFNKLTTSYISTLIENLPHNMWKEINKNMKE